MKFDIKKLTSFILLLIGVLIGQFIFTKAAVTSFTHDESFTYLHYTHDSFMNLISFSDWFMNNHILNSILTKYAEQLWGSSEFALRTPNLFALLVFMGYSYKLLPSHNFLLSISIFTLLHTNLLLIDLFGLARGYGLSYAFMMMSFFHFLKYLQKSTQKDLYLFHFGALLAILSHFTLLPFYVTLLFLFNLIKFLNARINKNENYLLFKTNKAHFIPLVINIAILFEPVRRALLFGQLDVAGKSGFYADTVTGFIQNLVNGIHLSNVSMVLMQCLVSLTILVPFVLISKKLIDRDETILHTYLGLFTTTLTILTITLIIILNHHILGADYPVGRFSIFLFPIFILHIGFFMDYLLKSVLAKAVIPSVSLLAIAGAISFLMGANSFKYIGWGYDSETKNMITLLNAYQQNMDSEAVNLKVAADWHFEPTINFYRVTKNMEWMNQVDREPWSTEDDYLYLFEKDLSLESNTYEVIKNFSNTKTVLIRLK